MNKKTFKAMPKVMAMILGCGGIVVAQAAAPIVDAQDVSRQNYSQAQTQTEQQNQLIAELVMQLNQLQTEIRQLRGQVEEQDYRIKQLSNQQREMYLDIDQRLNNSTTNFVQDPTSSANEASQSSTQVSDSADSNTDNSVANVESGAEISADAQALYNKAIQQLDAKEFAFAKSSFRTFLRDYPEASLAANAHYWLGQLHYRDQEFTQAEEQFRAVYEQYSSSNKKDVSMMKLGQIFEKRGEKARAIAMYEQLSQAFPNSTAGKFARSKLDTLR